MSITNNNPRWGFEVTLVTVFKSPKQAAKYFHSSKQTNGLEVCDENKTDSENIIHKQSSEQLRELYDVQARPQNGVDSHVEKKTKPENRQKILERRIKQQTCGKQEPNMR